MSYFDGIKVGDKVWSFEFGWGEVVNVEDYIEVLFESSPESIGYYDFDGVVVDNEGHRNQTLFWDEIKFEIPEKPALKLKNDYSDYIDKDYFGNANSMEQLIKFAKLLSLRDELCPDSRGFIFNPKIDGHAYYITIIEGKYRTAFTNTSELTTVYFKTKEDAQKICDILNSKRFEF